MTRKPRLQTQRKYLTALEDLHHVLQYSKSLNMGKFVRKHGVGGGFGAVLKEAGIISFTNLPGQGRGGTYKWVGIEPNPDMAIEVISKVNARNKKRKEEREREIAEESALEQMEIMKEKALKTGKLVIEMSDKPSPRVPTLGNFNNDLPISPRNHTVEKVFSRKTYFGLFTVTTEWRKSFK